MVYKAAIRAFLYSVFLGPQKQTIFRIACGPKFAYNRNAEDSLSNTCIVHQRVAEYNDNDWKNLTNWP